MEETYGEDVVNSPTHYNKQGIEVIDVIEAYDLPYHLGNVIKYILRHQYKGNPRQDLEKAYWYLSRHLEALEDAEDLALIEERKPGHFYVPGERVHWVGEPDTTGEVINEDSGIVVVLWDPTNKAGAKIITTPSKDRLVPMKIRSSGPRPTCGYAEGYVVPSKDRIAGDTDAASALKSEYYGYDGDEVIATCKNPACRAEIRAKDGFVLRNNRSYCCTTCSDLDNWKDSL